MPKKWKPRAWKDWTAKDWAVVALIVLAGSVVKRLFPDGWFSTLGALAYLSFFLIVWWVRRGCRDDGDATVRHRSPTHRRC